MSAPTTSARRALVLASLVLSGEAIYAIPYFLRRDYPDALVAALGITQTQLGSLSAAFGVFALLCYFPGGWIADRVSPRSLLTGSLVATAALGFGLATYPPYPAVVAIFAALGISTILLFWAALVKATRALGGDEAQGRAFGLLDGGRALCGALLGSLALVIFSRFVVPEHGLRGVILMYSTAVLLAAGATWLVVPSGQAPSTDRASWAELREVISMPGVRWMAVAVGCAYAGYWGTFNLAGYGTAGFGMTPAEAAQVSVFGVWFGPVSAVLAGWTADRIGASRALIGGLVVLAAAMALLAVTPPGVGTRASLWVASALSGAAAWGLRGIYYAMLSDAKVPTGRTGAAVGVVSVIGYTPDILVPLTIGLMLDQLDHALAYRLLFGGLALTAGVGGFAAWRLLRASREPTQSEALSRPAGGP